MLINIGYSLLVIYIIYSFTFGIQIVETATKAEGKKSTFLKFMFLWIAYIVVITYSGLVNSFDQPRMPLFIILPIFIVIGVFLRSKRSLMFYEHIPKAFPYYFQGFRIFVELVIYLMFIERLGPVYITFEGYNYEIYGAALFVILGLLTYKYKVLPEKITYLSNYLGLALLAVIVIIFITCVYFPHLWGAEESLIAPQFISIPYTFLPGILMPAAVFMHLFAIKQYHYHKKNIEA